MQELAFGLLPFTFLEGEPLFRWSRPVWAALSLVGVFGFVHILLRPRPGEATYDGRNQTLVVLLVAYLAVALTYWGYFRRRVRRVEAERETAHESEAAQPEAAQPEAAQPRPPQPQAAQPQAKAVSAEPMDAAPSATAATPTGERVRRAPASRRAARESSPVTIRASRESGP